MKKLISAVMAFAVACTGLAAMNAGATEIINVSDIYLQKYLASCEEIDDNGYFSWAAYNSDDYKVYCSQKNSERGIKNYYIVKKSSPKQFVIRIAKNADMSAVSSVLDTFGLSDNIEVKQQQKYTSVSVTLSDENGLQNAREICSELAEIDEIKEFTYYGDKYTINEGFQDGNAEGFAGVQFYDLFEDASEVDVNTVDVLNALDGDANEDGETDLADATAIIQAIGNPAKYALSAQGEFNADTDGNGLTGADALEIQYKEVVMKGMPE